MAIKKRSLDEDEPASDTESRRDEALRRALSTPPQPKQGSVKRKEQRSKKEKPSD
ncbi:hypothetical protein [Pseudotabrizicola sp. 4114]|uniref:hypothetical protein n=1 Tax=Pseudotabrizicola sp. 4114 TaxID=2817731 RepID=UPI0032B80060